MRRSHFIILLLTATPVVVAAQSVKPGDRVQVTAPDLTRYDGTLQALTRDTLTVDTLRIAVASVTRLDVHRGRHAGIVRGVMIGAGVGAFIGFFVGAAQAQDPPPQCGIGQVFCPGPNWEKALIYGLVGIPLGAGAGALLGRIFASNRWEKVPLDGLRLSFAPQRDGRFAFGLSVRF